MRAAATTGDLGDRHVLVRRGVIDRMRARGEARVANVRAPADVADHGLDRQSRELGPETPLDAEQVVLGMIDQRQRRRLARGQLARQLRADAASGTGDQQTPVLERAPIDRRQHALHRPPEQPLLRRPIQLDHDCSSRITMSTRRLRARFSAESFGARG